MPTRDHISAALSDFGLVYFVTEPGTIGIFYLFLWNNYILEVPLYYPLLKLVLRDILILWLLAHVETHVCSYLFYHILEFLLML